jgi:hypothetical protein
MPSFLKYGSTGRPPGKFHLRHSLKEFTSFSEFPHPSFEIFFINNNNNINYIGNGDSGTDGDTNDIVAPVPVGNNSNTSVLGHRSNRIDTWFTDRIEPYKFNKYKFNIDRISTTTPATTTTNHKTSAEGISNEDGEAGLSVWSTDRIESNQFNSGTDQIESTQFWYKFNIKAISTTSTTIAPATPATPATVTINYKTSAEGISNEGGEEAEAAAGLSEWFADLFESNQCNSISNNNNSNTGSISTSNKDNFNETSHLPFIITLLCLIIIKSFSPKEFKTAPKEKQQQQQHYHGKQRHQFHLEQQQKHQYFKQHHNVERMTASIVLKLTLVAWDMWTYRNGF